MLFSLCDDVLEHIVGFLKTTEQLNVRATSREGKQFYERKPRHLNVSLERVTNKVWHTFKREVLVNLFVDRPFDRGCLRRLPGELFGVVVKEKFKQYCGDFFIRVDDVSCFSGVHTLDLKCCHNITDVSMLSNVHTLNLSMCFNILDVSPLAMVHTLDLSSTSVEDVSMLGNVHTLNLACCSKITDVSMLGNVYDLNLSETYIRDVSALGNVHTLNLEWCCNVNDLSALGNVKLLKSPR